MKIRNVIHMLRRRQDLRKVLALVAAGVAASCTTAVEPGEESPAGDGCGAGQTLCGGACVSTLVDAHNCGACGSECGTGQLCSSGICSCGEGLSACADGCAVLSSSATNCGACGNVCGAGLVCSLGQCASTCAVGLTQCDSSCVDVGSDPGNCGTCGSACDPGETCSGGTCVCPTGQMECGGTCADTLSDPGNCGTCGNACTGGASCTSGVCTGGGTGGGFGSGGASSGGASSGGASSGGASSGGAMSGGASSGGAMSGGASSGGSGNTTCTNVRPTGTEWDAATCDDWAAHTSECQAAWMIDNNYCNQSCGRCSSGGSGGSSSGGASSGGAGSGGSPSTCNQADLQVCGNQIGTHCGYTYEYWKDSGSGCLVNTNDGFSVDWSGINNLLGRKGVRPGNANNVVNYSANYQPNGNSYLCVYGWTTGPLVEYYIVDSWGSWRPPGNTGFKGTVSSDGGTYDIYLTERVNQPSIEGNKTFYQFWSVRQSKRTSGSITVKNHFNAWASHGMTMGNLYEVSMTVEGYQSSGSADVTMSITTSP